MKLELKNIKKSFGEKVVLKGISFTSCFILLSNLSIKFRCCSSATPPRAFSSLYSLFPVYSQLIPL